MSFSLQYISDIHLEYREECTKIEDMLIPVSKNLALCGDIGNLGSDRYREFIYMCSEKFENVFVIFGNHEFYNEKDMVQIQTIEEIKTNLQNTSFPPNVHFLDNCTVFINTRTNRVYQQCPQDAQHEILQIIGSTLWTDVDKKLGTVMNDYKHIYVGTNTHTQKLLTPDDVLGLYKKNVEYILEQLDKHPNVTTVLLTHHGPHPVCNGEYTNNVLQSAYTSFIPELYRRINLLACISGHTHSSVNQSVSFENNHITFLSNQYGYPGESQAFLKYNPEAKLEIPLLL